MGTRTASSKVYKPRIRLFFVSLLIAFASIATPFLVSTPTYADTASDIHDITYKYYAARYLRDCLANRGSARKHIDSRYIIDGAFTSGHKVVIGRYLEPVDGLAGCEESALINTALLSLGYADDPGRLLTDIGYTKQGNYYERRADDTDTMNATIVDKLQLPNYARYVYYQKLFSENCQLLELNSGGNGEIITVKKMVLGDDGEYSVKDVQMQWKDMSVHGSITKYDYLADQVTCDDLRKSLDILVTAAMIYNNDHKDDAIDEKTNNTPATTDCSKNPDADECKDRITCTIEGIGWFVCPAMTFMATINDQAYGFLAEKFLAIDTGLLTGANSAWARFRDIANILFVVALLLVVYSQITSVGISNYGIKKMLPRIVVAALLVNLSFLICQIAVDLSNILGYGITQFFGSINIGESSSGGGISGLQWTAVIGTILGLAVGIAFAISVPVVVSALLAIGLIALILIARQALIVLLVAIAPLAFVAYLLPNTEQWFKKWTKMFSTLLLLFPIIGLVFAASRLAGGIIAKAAGDDWLMKVVALAVTALPFFVVPGLLKGALDAAGAVGAKLKGMADQRMSRAREGTAKKARERYERSAFARGKKLREQGKDDYRTRQYARAVAGEDTSIIGRARRRAAAGVTGRAWTPAGEYAAGRAERVAEGKVKEVEQEEIKYATESQRGMTTADVAKIAQTGVHNGVRVSEAERAAAIDRTMSTGGFNDRRKVLEAMASNKNSTTQEMRQRAVSGAYAKGDQDIYGTGFGDQIVSGVGSINSGGDLLKAAVDNAAGGNVKPEQLVKNSSATKYLVDGVRAGTTAAHTSAKANLVSAAGEAEVGEGTKTQIDQNIAASFADLRRP